MARFTERDAASSITQRPTPRVTCLLTFDFDAMSSWIASDLPKNPSMLSRGEFGAVALPRILALLARYKAPATFFVPGHTACAYPWLMEEIRGRGHEIAHHGWVHENPTRLDRDAERRTLERGTQVLEKVTGCRPRGYRSPAWELSEHTIDLLSEAGFLYDSSCMGDDMSPYYVRTGDARSETDAYVFGEPSELVEMPVAWHLDDAPLFDYVKGRGGGLAAPSAVEEIWRGDFDYAYRNPGAIYLLTMHPQVIGRGHRLLMLDRLLGYVAGHEDVAFERLADHAERWRTEHPVAEWRQNNWAHSPRDGTSGLS